MLIALRHSPLARALKFRGAGELMTASVTVMRLMTDETEVFFECLDVLARRSVEVDQGVFRVGRCDSFAFPPFLLLCRYLTYTL